MEILGKVSEKELIECIAREIRYEIDKIEKEAIEAEKNRIKNRFEILDL